jgi:hypothetical protein
MALCFTPAIFGINSNPMIPNTLRIKLSLTTAALLAIAACTNTTEHSSAADQDIASDSVGTNSQQAGKQQIDADTAQAVRDQTTGLNPEIVQWSDSLNKHFNPGQVALLDRAITQSKEIVSASDLAGFYQGMLRDSVQPLIEKKFQQDCRHADYGGFADDDWDWITEAFPFIATRVSCHDTDNGTVCAHQAPISLLPLKAIALNTPQKEDDQYFDVLIAIHSGTEPGVPLETEVYDGREDYASAQPESAVGLLGDGHTGDIVRKMALAARARKLFNKALSADLKLLLSSLKEEHYYYSKSAVLNELDEIIAAGTTSKLMTSREITSLQETQQWLLKKENGFDCGTGDCEQTHSSPEP